MKRENDPSGDEKASGATKTGAKKAYRRPEILYRQPLEASAALCTGPGQKPNPGACPGGPPSS